MVEKNVASSKRLPKTAKSMTKSMAKSKTLSRSAKSGGFVSKPLTFKSPRVDAWVADLAEATVSSSALHRDTRPTLDLLQTSAAVAVTHYNEVEGYLVAPEMFEDLVIRVGEAEARESELTSTVTMLLAAARTGVPVPSDMLERVMPDVDVAEQWREIAEFAAAFPVRLAAGEHGEPLTRARLSYVGGPIEESGSDDDLDLD